MIKFHMRKLKPFIHILSNFHEFLSTPTPCAAAVNWSGSEARFEETQDQLSPRDFENTGSNLFFYVECSYLVNIKPNYSRICWYKKFYSPKHYSPTYEQAFYCSYFFLLFPTFPTFLFWSYFFLLFLQILLPFLLFHKKSEEKKNYVS